MFVAFTTLVNVYFDKIITTGSPKSHNPVFYINLLMLLFSYYAQNYAGKIGSSLTRVHNIMYS